MARSKNKGWLIALLGIAAFVGLVLIWYRTNTANDSTPAVMAAAYETDIPARVVAKVEGELGMITRIKLTSDDQQMFVTTLSGTVWIFTNQNGRFVKQPTPLYQMNLGWPEGAENGLTGLIVGLDYGSNQNIFLTYATTTNGRTGQNQILRLTVVREGDIYVARDPQVIFSANSPAAGAHQIQGGESLRIEGQPHLLFAIGENYRPEEALDLTKESGKIMLIRETGENPLGARPYPQAPKIQAIGIRNVYELAIDPVNEGWVYWAENAADRFDRIVHVPLLDATKQISGNWAGDDVVLDEVSVNGENSSQHIAYLWDKVVSPNALVADNLGRFYVGTFSSVASPVKEILMFERDRDGVWQKKTIVSRKDDFSGGNLLGMAMSQKGDFYFGDFSDGAIYVLTRVWSPILKN